MTTIRTQALCPKCDEPVTTDNRGMVTNHVCRPREVTRLLGQMVHVKLDENTVVTGRLLAFDDSGGFVIDEGDGTVHHCWPMLSIEAAS